MKYYFKRNLKIINELMTYLYKLGSKDITVNLHRDENKTSFVISAQIDTIDTQELIKLDAILNTKRQHGMMIDSAIISYDNNIIKLEILRNDS